MTTITVTVVGSEPDMLNEQTRLHLSCGCSTPVPTDDEESLSFIGAEVRDHVCASASRSVFITDRRHTLQFTRQNTASSSWLVTMDGQHQAREVATDFVQSAIEQSTAKGCTVTAFAD